jgi:hypothetical protein
VERVDDGCVAGEVLAGGGVKYLYVESAAFEAIGASPDPIKASDRKWQWNCLVDATARLRQHGIDPYIDPQGVAS